MTENGIPQAKNYKQMKNDIIIPSKLITKVRQRFGSIVTYVFSIPSKLRFQTPHALFRIVTYVFSIPSKPDSWQVFALQV